MSTGDWHDNRKCQELTPKEADELFFPKPGGKSKAARVYCLSCPVQAFCLREAMELGGPGFWAGTTEDERRRMVEFLGLVQATAEDFAPEVKRPRLRKVNKTSNVHDYLLDLDGPTDEELQELDQAS